MPLREALHLPVLIKYNTVVKQLGGGQNCNKW